MCEVRSTLIELQPTNDAMLGEIFWHSGLWNAEMLRQLRLDRIHAATARSPTQQVPDGDAQRLASLDVVIAGEVGVRQKQDAGTHGSVVGLIEFYRRASEQAAELHL